MGVQYSQLTLGERNRIAELFEQGKKLTEIARILDRNKGTISRELSRNAWLGAWYFPLTADLEAKERKRVSSSRMRVDPNTWKLVEKKLKLKWSPDQISQRLKLEKKGKISATTIYRWIWLDRKGGGELYRHLRINNRRRKKRNLPLRQRGPIHGERSIAERPKVVDQRLRTGDLEGDTIHFSSNRKAGLLTVTDRVSKFIKIRKLRRRSSKSTALHASRAIASMPITCKTLTLDRGPEFAAHLKIENQAQLKVYFAEPYCASQRGSIENQNGLIRQFFGRGYCIDQASAYEIQKVESLLNNRPRKSLGYLTPWEYVQSEKAGTAMKAKK